MKTLEIFQTFSTHMARIVDVIFLISISETTQKCLASLYFSGHTFSISPCSSFVPAFDGKMRQYYDQSISTELVGDWGATAPKYW